MPQPLTSVGKEAFRGFWPRNWRPETAGAFAHAIADARATGSYTKDFFKTLIWDRPGTEAGAGLSLHERLPGSDMAQGTTLKRRPHAL